MTEALVTVIIPTYKRYDLLERAICSVQSQTYTNLEIIIIDDNPPESKSRELTQKTITKFLADKRIRYFSNERNMGVSLTRNRGIEASSGEYVTFLDDDDAYLPNKVATQVAYMQEHNLDLCLCDGAIYDNNDTLIKTKKRNLSLNMSQEDLMRYHLMFHLTGTNTMMYRTSFLRKIGGFDNVKAAEEYYLTEKAIQAGAKIGNVDAALTKTYMHRGKHITTSEVKINTENDLYQNKKKQFDLLSSKEKRVVKCRHYATLSYAYIRCKEYAKCAKNCFLGFVISPVLFLKICIENAKKL